MKKLPRLIIAVLFISLSVAFMVGCDVQTTSNSSETPEDQTLSSSLFAARNLAGTWKTTFPVEFHVQTDFRTLDGTLEDAATIERIMTWIITSTGNENEINIECFVDDTSIQRVEVDPPISYTPDVFPIQFKGQISGTRLTTPFGEFNFTTDIITGTWDYTETFVYTQKTYTKSNTLILTGK